MGYEGTRIKAVRCTECGSRRARFTAATVTGIQRIVFVVEDDGSVGVRASDGWDKPLRKLQASTSDMNLNEFAYCGICGVEAEGWEFVVYDDVEDGEAS